LFRRRCFNPRVFTVGFHPVADCKGVLSRKARGFEFGLNRIGLKRGKRSGWSGWSTVHQPKRSVPRRRRISSAKRIQFSQSGLSRMTSTHERPSTKIGTPRFNKIAHPTRRLAIDEVGNPARIFAFAGRSDRLAPSSSHALRERTNERGCRTVPRHRSSPLLEHDRQEEVGNRRPHQSVVRRETSGNAATEAAYPPQAGG